MKLSTFSVTNFRSITATHKMEIFDYTVFVGKNSEGKSNVLKALAVSMNALIMHNRRYPLLARQRDESLYYWERDFPTFLQMRGKNTESIFRISFCLSQVEIEKFRDLFGVNTNMDLPLEIRIGKDNAPKISVKKQGSPAFNLHAEEILEFISSSISINYIPAIRTGIDITKVISLILGEELQSLDKNDDYKRAQGVIQEMQTKLLESIAHKITPSLNDFVPGVRAIKIEMQEDKRRLSPRRDISLQIDDGVFTDINFKGDGIKSLVALAMLKDKEMTRSTPIIAVEEPEAHLHPGAMHRLNEVLRNLSHTNQVIITTHNPVFVRRDNHKANIIIRDSKAEPAKSVRCTTKRHV